MSYGYPPPVYRPPGYHPGMPPGMAQGPPRGLLITGGVLSIIQSSLLLLASLLIILAGIGGGSLLRDIGVNRSEGDMAALVGAAIFIYAGMGIISASFSMAGRPGWTIASGILQAIITLLWIVAMIGGGPGPVIFVILSLCACIFTFVGVGQAQRRLAWKRARGG